MQPEVSVPRGIPQTRVGMLTPSSNTVLEPATNVLLEPIAEQVSAHFARFRVTRIALDDGADNQFECEPILAAADLLADAYPSVIAWNGTAASWRGFETDDALCAAIKARTGITATSAIVSLNALLEQFAAQRIGLVTPYTADVERRIVANYGELGIETVAARRGDTADNFAFAGFTPSVVAEMCAEVAAARPDVIVILCTNMRGPLIGAEVEARFDIPVLDSVSVTLWGALRAAGVDSAPLTRFGRLFARTGIPPS